MDEVTLTPERIEQLMNARRKKIDEEKSQIKRKPTENMDKDLQAKRSSDDAEEGGRLSLAAATGQQHRTYYPLQELENLASEVNGRSLSIDEKDFTALPISLPSSISSGYYTTTATGSPYSAEARKSRFAVLSASIDDFEIETKSHPKFKHDRKSAQTKTTSKQPRFRVISGAWSSTRNSGSSESEASTKTETEAGSTTDEGYSAIAGSLVEEELPAVTELSASQDCGIEAFCRKKDKAQDAAKEVVSVSPEKPSPDTGVLSFAVIKDSSLKASNQESLPPPLDMEGTKTEAKVGSLKNHWENITSVEKCNQPPKTDAVRPKATSAATKINKKVTFDANTFRKEAAKEMNKPLPIPAVVITAEKFTDSSENQPDEELNEKLHEKVVKLRQRWEIASSTGTPMQPTASLTEYDGSPTRSAFSVAMKKIASIAKENCSKETRPKKEPELFTASLVTIGGDGVTAPVSEVVDSVAEEETQKKRIGIPIASAPSTGLLVEPLLDEEKLFDDEKYNDEVDIMKRVEGSANSLHVDVTNSVPVRDGNSDRSKLVYTLSLYRSLEKDHMATASPVRAIVKIPEVTDHDSSTRASPPSERQSLRISLAFDKKVKEINEAIQVQQEQILQASRGLDYCHQTEQFCKSIQEIEFQKALLIAKEKRRALITELDRINQYRLNHIYPMREPRGTVTISDIKIPLRNEFITFSNKTPDSKIYYFICLLKYRDLLLATPLISSDDALRTGCLEFPNYVQMSNLPHDFNLELTVHTLPSQREELGREERFRTGTSYTMKSKNRPNVSVFAVQDTCFQLMGQANLNLLSVRQRKFALQGVTHSAPIENLIYMKLRCCIEGVDSIEKRGFLNVYEELSDLGAWSRYWCVMVDGVMKFWRYPEDVQQDPIFVINLSNCTQFVDALHGDVCTRPNTMRIDVHGSGPVPIAKKYLLSAETKEEFRGWANNVSATMRELCLWNPDMAGSSDV